MSAACLLRVCGYKAVEASRVRGTLKCVRLLSLEALNTSSTNLTQKMGNESAIRDQSHDLPSRTVVKNTPPRTKTRKGWVTHATEEEVVVHIHFFLFPSVAPLA